MLRCWGAGMLLDTMMLNRLVLTKNLEKLRKNLENLEKLRKNLENLEKLRKNLENLEKT